MRVARICDVGWVGQVRHSGCGGCWLSAIRPTGNAPRTWAAVALSIECSREEDVLDALW